MLAFEHKGLSFRHFRNFTQVGDMNIFTFSFFIAYRQTDFLNFHRYIQVLNLVFCGISEHCRLIGPFYMYAASTFQRAADSSLLYKKSPPDGELFARKPFSLI